MDLRSARLGRHFSVVGTCLFFIVMANCVQSRPHLMNAARSGSVADVAKWLESHNVNAKDSGGHTPIMWAAIGGHVEVLNYLVEHKANINARDRVGHTALMLACREGRTSAVEFLVSLTP